jgi:hypothetical protein
MAWCRSFNDVVNAYAHADGRLMVGPKARLRRLMSAGEGVDFCAGGFRGASAVHQP